MDVHFSNDINSNIFWCNYTKVSTPYIVDFGALKTIVTRYWAGNKTAKQNYNEGCFARSHRRARV